MPGSLRVASWLRTLRHWSPVLLLAPGQLVSWGTLYYGLAFLAEPIRQATGWTFTQIFGAYSAGLVVAAVCAPWVGALFARHGGRACLTAGSLTAAAALVTIGLSPSLPVFWLGWLVAGAAMAATLYEAAFSALREVSGTTFRRNVGALAVVSGLASTLAWPLSVWLEGLADWRTAFLVFAALHVLIAVPAHRSLPRRAPETGAPDTASGPRDSPGRTGNPPVPVLVLLALAFALAAIVSTAIAAHIGVILTAQNVAPALALWAATLIGPAQVMARMLDMALHGVWPIRALGQVALALPPLAIGLLLLAPEWPSIALLFALLYGAGHGLVTIVKALIPNLLVPAAAYARVTGWLAAPAHCARALTPGLIALLIESAAMAWTLLVLAAAGGLSALAFVGALALSRSQACRGLAAGNG